MLELRHVTRTYELGGERAGVFGVSLEVPRGCVAVLAGPSGSGKTTVLQMAGLLDPPDEGEVYLEGELDLEEAMGSVVQSAEAELRAWSRGKPVERRGRPRNRY